MIQLEAMHILYPLRMPFLPSSEIYWLYILGALLIALLLYMLDGKDKTQQQNLLQYLFPKEIYLHPSAITEYKYYFAASLLNILLLIPAISSLPNLADITCDYLTKITHINAPFAIAHPHWYDYGILSVFLALVGDFAYYCYHYLAHRNSFFWEFHKVHHSAEVLTPLTIYRGHPVDLGLSLLINTLMLGFATGIWVYLFGNQVSQILIYGVSCELFLFYLTGSNLRHSHIWLNYPYGISYIVMSPAQHHIHHSIEPKHYDKNFGYILSFWDWVFGTLYIPIGYEKISFGLANGESQMYNSTTNLFVQPFKAVWQSYAQLFSEHQISKNQVLTNQEEYEAEQ